MRNCHVPHLEFMTFLFRPNIFEVSQQLQISFRKMENVFESICVFNHSCS